MLCIENEERMDKMQKCLAISGAGAVGIAGIVLIVKAARRRTGMFEKMGKNIDERLRKPKAALEEATVRLQGVIERVKNLKP